MARVLYLAGWGRSGTTIIDNILGSYPGVFTAGELCFLWRRGIIGGRICGCGTKVRDCEVWREVLRAAFGDNPPDPYRVVAWQEEAARARHAPQLLRSEHPLGEIMARVYNAIVRVTGATVIVDSSKLPSGAALLARRTDVSAYLLHVVRDPRAVAHSWQRPKSQLDRPKPALMKPHGLADSTTKWLSWNALTELTARAYPGRHLRIRYEEFAAAPRDVVEAILDLVGLPTQDGPFRGDRTVELASNHTVSGNPGRFRTGTVEIRADEAWRAELPRSSRLLTNSMAWPLMGRYGYLLQ